MSIRHGQNTSDDIDYNSDDFSEGEPFIGLQWKESFCYDTIEMSQQRLFPDRKGV